MSEQFSELKSESVQVDSQVKQDHQPPDVERGDCQAWIQPSYMVSPMM